MNLIIIILILIILIVYLYCDDFKYHIINEKGEKTVLMLGTIHGNEPAGSVALNEFINTNTNTNIRFIIIPTVNRCGKFLCMRNNPLNYFKNLCIENTCADYNRHFKSNTTFSNINKKIIKLMKKADFILDFHEGYDFHRINKDSIGSTLTPGYTDESHDMALKMLNSVNNSIDDDNKKFMILTNREDLIKKQPDIYSNESNIPNSLDYYAKNNSYKKYNYILIETSGINNKQPLHVRKNQIKQIINTLIENIN